MMLNSVEAFISAFGSIQKPISFLVGSPLSMDGSGKGVPGIRAILDIVREVVNTEVPLKASSYEEAIQGKSGSIVDPIFRTIV